MILKDTAANWSECQHHRVSENQILDLARCPEITVNTRKVMMSFCTSVFRKRKGSALSLVSPISQWFLTPRNDKNWHLRNVDHMYLFFFSLNFNTIIYSIGKFSFSYRPKNLMTKLCRCACVKTTTVSRNKQTNKGWNMQSVSPSTATGFRHIYTFL